MVATASPIPKKRLPAKVKDIPRVLIYEIMDGKPIYYEGYKEVLKNHKTVEDIMGSSRLQTRIIMAIIAYLWNFLSEDTYEIASNEFGLHLGHRENVSGDIGIFMLSDLADTPDNDEYFTVPPKVMIEIDTNAAADFMQEGEYYYRKTQKLLDFGVERVIWYYTKSKKVMVAEQGKSWTIDNWDKTVPVIEGLELCLTELLEKKGIKI